MDEIAEVTKDDLELILEEFDMDKREDKLWQERTGLNADSLCGAIETIIFMSDRPVHLTKIRNLIDEEMPLRVLHEAINRLQEEYESRHHGLRLLEVAEGYQFRTKATYSKYVQDLFKVNSLVLTPSALEVLAIIAYKQPVSKTEIEKIRGVDSSHIVRGLMDKRLVKMVGRSEEVGRPSLYGTTQEFLEVFNLSDLSMLPPERELEELSESSVGKIGDIKSICSADKKEIFNLDELEELDKLSAEIKNISSETEFTQSIKLEEKRKVDGENSIPKKSVFDLLEEHVVFKSIKENNEEASISNTVGNIVSPSIVNDLTLGPYNIPDLEEDDEDFQMIDLDTGEAITSDTEEEVLLFSDSDNDDEGENLAKALENAFNNMQLGNLNDEESKGLTDGLLDNIDESINAISTLNEKIVKEGEGMDIDLSFLEDTENPTE